MMFVNTLLVSAPLLLYINSPVLVVVFEQRSDGVVFHITIAANLQRLQIMGKVVINDVYSSLEIDEVVVCMRTTVFDKLLIRNTCSGTLPFSMCSFCSIHFLLIVFYLFLFCHLQRNMYQIKSNY